MAGTAKVDTWRLKPPRQRRSRETLRRIIDATEGLLAEKSFDEIPVTQIVKRAGSSVGAFYARFHDKDTLLDHLDTLFHEEMTVAAMAYRDDDKWRTAPLDVLVTEIVRYFVDFHRRHNGLLRTLAVRRRAGGRADHTPQSNPIAGVLAQRVMSHRREIDHPNPELAVHLGLAMVLHTIRERILFPESFESEAPVTEGILKQELVRAYLHYLDIPTKGHR